MHVLQDRIPQCESGESVRALPLPHPMISPAPGREFGLSPRNLAEGCVPRRTPLLRGRPSLNEHRPLTKASEARSPRFSR